MLKNKRDQELSNKRKVTEQRKTRQGTKRGPYRKKDKSTLEKAVLFCLTILIINTFGNCENVKIDDRFYICQSGGYENNVWEKPFLAVEEGCADRKNEQKMLTIPIKPFSTSILSSIVHQVRGTGYECKKEIVKVTTEESPIFAKYKNIEIQPLKLSRRECEIMIETKKCDGQQMECEGSICNHDGTPKTKFEWWTTTVETGISCTITTRLITAYTRESTVINDNCVASSLQCQLKESIVIWSENIIKTCTLNLLVSKANFTNEDNDIIYDRTNRHLLKLKEKTNECGLDVYKTSEGLYVSFDEQAEKIEKSEFDLSGVNDLVLSEIDGDIYSTSLQLEALKQRLCEGFASVLRLMKINEDIFDTVKDQKRRTRVFYAKNGLIFLPMCAEARTIYVDKDDNDEECYEDLKRLDSKIVNCSNKILYRYFTNSSTIVIKNEKKLEIHKAGNPINLRSL